MQAVIIRYFFFTDIKLICDISIGSGESMKLTANLTKMIFKKVDHQIILSVPFYKSVKTNLIRWILIFFYLFDLSNLSTPNNFGL